MKQNMAPGILKNLYLTGFVACLNNVAQGVGLFKGNMGIAVSLSNLSFLIDNPVIPVYIRYFVDKTFQNGVMEISDSFDKGLTGLGWGLNYLMYNGHVKDVEKYCGMVDSLLCERLSERNPQSMLEQTGLADYILIRKLNEVSSRPSQSPGHSYLSDRLLEDISRMHCGEFTRQNDTENIKSLCHKSMAKILGYIPMLRFSNKLIKPYIDDFRRDACELL